MFTSRKRIILTTVIVTTIVVIGAGFVFHGDGDGAPGTQVGGGDTPTARTQAVLQSLPLHPRATIDHPGLNTEAGVNAFYWVDDKPEKVMAFYTAELPSRGWVMERAPTIEVGEAKADGTQASALTATFIKDDLRMHIAVIQNTKDPERGAASLRVLVEPR